MALGFQGCLGFGGNITLPAEAGATYYIQAGSVGIVGPASLNLNVQQVPPPVERRVRRFLKTVGAPFRTSTSWTCSQRPSNLVSKRTPPGVFATFPRDLRGTAFTALADEHFDAGHGARLL